MEVESWLSRKPPFYCGGLVGRWVIEDHVHLEFRFDLRIEFSKEVLGAMALLGLRDDLAGGDIESRVATADLELYDPGRPVVAQRVSGERLVSFTDPTARHGRKSKRQTVKGFKLHPALRGGGDSGLHAAHGRMTHRRAGLGLSSAANFARSPDPLRCCSRPRSEGVWLRRSGRPKRRRPPLSDPWGPTRPPARSGSGVAD